MKTIIAFSLILQTIWLYAACSANELSKNKEFDVKTGEVSARVVVSSFTESQPCKTAASWRWGAENVCPSTFIEVLEVKVNGNLLFVPLSSFADLGNPRKVRIEVHNGKKRFAVVLTGGDAATSYSATLEFRNNLLSERIVRHGEFPSEAWEKTHYKFNLQN
ncbi:hypothetical protein BAC1_01571 [uncultured bacterium]|nr:hypothetical protein BAC1_01571 [uncultured bacterium]